MPAPVALIIGITGQDGSFLAELLLRKGYVVHGLRRRTSVPNLGNLAGLPGAGLHLHHGDVTEGGSLLRILQRVRPDEVYNLAGLTLAAGLAPQTAAGLHALGTQRLLDALRVHDAGRAIRFLQGSSYEIFGPGSAPATEAAGFSPDTSVGVARLQAYWLIAEARDGQGLHASSGIGFPHGSARAAPNSLLRHIARSVVALADGATHPLVLGALDAVQHWGHARDHAEAMWRMLQQERPSDLVLASGAVLALRAVVERAFHLAGIGLGWHGAGWAETGRCARTGRLLVRLDPAGLTCRGRCGDSSRASRLLGWAPRADLDGLLAEILENERMALPAMSA